MTFEELILPWEAERFWAAIWERETAHLSGREAEYYDPLATVSEIDALVFGPAGLAAAEVSLYRGIDGKPATEWTAPGPIRSGAELRRLHDRGHNLLIASAERFLPRLAALLAGLEARFKARCLAHLILSPANAPGLAPHRDGYGVFALQIAGAKTWSLYPGEPAAAAGGASDEHQLIDAPPSRRIETAPGDLLYLPRGTIHAAATAGERSIHVSLAICPPRGADALSLLARAAEEMPFFGEYIPYGIGETAERRRQYAEAFRARLAALAAETDIFALLDKRRAERAKKSSPAASPREGSRAGPSGRASTGAPDRRRPPRSASRDGGG